MLFMVKPSLVASVWAGVEPLILRALDCGRDEYTSRDVFRLCKSGAWQLWALPGPSGAGCTEIYDYPGYRSCIVRLWASNAPLDHLLGDVGRVEDWAREQGCAAIEVFGRRGWLRALDGYEESLSVARKAL